MLKNQVGDDWWLVHQPDHARVAGYLAAHWGGVNGFARAGRYAPFPNPGLLQQEVVRAIAEHDNGWWEWEAAPAIDPADSLPLDLPDVGNERADAGLNRWRLGVPRLAETHPYVALLISMHAYWLYAFAFDDLPELDDAFRHPIFGRVGVANKLVSHPELTREFLGGQQAIQRQLKTRLRRDSQWAAAVDAAHLFPHARLLQTLDALSLLISFGGQQEAILEDIPRAAWDDRARMSWQPVAERRIVCDPYPFDVDPLEVFLPVRTISNSPRPAGDQNDTPPLVRLHATPLRAIRFVIASSNGRDTVS